MPEPQAERLGELLIEEEMKDAYLTFAMSVIISRALPDVRDGLKPSQRRILVAMDDLGLGPRSKTRKCAKICGDTSGNYHPHGEQVIYPTLVRLAQPWVMRYPLVEGQGNFGSVDGDPPAAMRYTEARMTHFATMMLQDLNLNAVDFVPNYDGTRQEPSVLPGAFPNLLANGSTGIAVGMATSIPPHNLTQLCDALVALIAEPDIHIDRLIDIVGGPDFPTGAIICGREAVREGYRTGRSTIAVRARAHTEVTRQGKKSIVVTEIPYLVNKTNLIERIAELVQKDRLKDVSDIRDESDREGMRIVIDLRPGADEKVVLNQLYASTMLQDSFSINMIALVNQRPRTLNLKEMLGYFLEHRVTVVRRRSEYLLAQAKERAHIVEGLLIAVDHIDEVVRIIRKAKDVPTARENLMARFKLTERQAEAILRMRLSQLTGLERAALEAEYKELKEKIAYYEALLADERLIYDVIREDLIELKDRFGDARRTEIVDASPTEFDIEDLIAEESVAVTVSHAGYVKRQPLTSYRRQGRGGQGVTGADVREGDFIEHLFIASTHDYILFFTDAGQVYWQKVYDIPQMGRTSRGRALVNLLELGKDETLTSMIPVRTFDERNLVMATQQGVVKKVVLSAFGHPKRGGIRAIELDQGDRLIDVALTSGKEEVVLGTRDGMAIRFHEGHIRAMGRAARGVRGIRLRQGDQVVGMVVVDRQATLLTVCENGYGKRTSFDEYRQQSRGGQGIINIKTSDRNGRVVGVTAVSDADEMMVITAGGMVMRMPVKGIRTIGRNTQGVRMIRLREDDHLIAVARVLSEEVEGTNGPPATSNGEMNGPDEAATAPEEDEPGADPEAPSSDDDA
jgi:DNA gyrase subunit A